MGDLKYVNGHAGNCTFIDVLSKVSRVFILLARLHECPGVGVGGG